jgi:predicted phosphodiesterase
MVKVILTGDLHIGAGTVDVEEILRVKERYWLAKPIILMGDLVDAGLNRGMQFDNKLNPDTQIEELKKVLKGLDVRTALIGNHEQRFFREAGINIYKLLELPQKHEFSIDGCDFYVSHGKSAARNPLTEFTKFYEFVDADIIALGHNHVLGSWNVWRGGRRVVLCRTGSFIGYADYALENGYAPTIKGWIEVNTKSKVATCYSLINGTKTGSLKVVQKRIYNTW